MEPLKYQKIRGRLRDAGMRPTITRVCVMQVLANASAPMATEDVFRVLVWQGFSVRSGTVYRALADLTAAGIVLREPVAGRNGARAGFSLLPAEDDAAGDAPSGYTLVCRRCSYGMSFTDPALLAHLSRITGLHDLAQHAGELTIAVECLGCIKDGVSKDKHDARFPEMLSV